MQADLFQPQCPNGGPCICLSGPHPGGMIAGDRCGLGPLAPAYQEAKEDRGLRFNGDKVRVDLLPTQPLWALAQLMTVNSHKYPDGNWEKGMPYSEVIASMERHFFKLKSGQDIDPTDNQHEAIKIMWNAMALYYYWLNGVGTDDRRKVELPEMRPLPADAAARAEQERMATHGK